MGALKIKVVSDKGIQRTKNEDMICVNGEFLRDGVLTKELYVANNNIAYVLVADGMGGHEKGEYASEYLLSNIRINLPNIFNFEKDFSELVSWISKDLNKKAEIEGQTRPMGCTLTGVVWFKGKIWVVNAGDSRTYRLREGLLNQLTQDENLSHKYGYDMGVKGLALYNCIGGGCDGLVSIQDFTDRIIEGDLLLVCSDGLTDMVSDSEIENTLNTSKTPVEDLAKKANLNGGSDNISIIVVQVYSKLGLNNDKNTISIFSSIKGLLSKITK